VKVEIAGEIGTVASILTPDPRHALAEGSRQATNFELPVPPSDRPHSITVSFKRKVLFSTRRPGDRRDGTPAHAIGMGRQDRMPSPDGPATVIVPVYADYEATRACIESLLHQLPDDARGRAIIVNEASPDGRITDYLACVGKDRRMRVLTNERNVGFVGSVNRAIASATGGDIVLLNADTIVPNGFIDRLAAAARTSPDIGTVTSLSNNGEFTSFPVPNAQNSLPGADEIESIDRIAAIANAGRVADIPNGIGFCLYITRACLDAVGSLSGDYHRGYLEDVDFCLRARALGFRSVCAPSVFVGHAGTRSFGKEKRSLVVRNLAIVERRFPDYRAECSAFVALDPLRPSRQAIERSAPPQDHRPRLLVAGAGAAAAVAQERARCLMLSTGEASFILTVQRGPCGPAVAIADGAAAAPQSIIFDLAAPGEWGALFGYLQATNPTRIEFADLACIPAAIADGLLELDIPYDILNPHGGTRRVNISSCEPAGIEVADDRSTAFGRKENVNRLQNGSRRCLGLFPVRICLQEQRLMRAVALGLRKTWPSLSIVVIGGTLDDPGLMRIGNMFVTGPVDAAEMGHVCRAYELSSLFLCAAPPLSAHPIQTSVASVGLPLAYIDGANGCYAPKHEDLLLAPHATADEIIGELSRWLRAY